MDPDKCLEEMRELAKTVNEGLALDDSPAYRLADLVLGLDEWLSKKGFLPKDWQR